MNFKMWKKNSILINFRDLWRKLLLDFLILHQGTSNTGTSDKVHINFNFHPPSVKMARGKYFYGASDLDIKFKGKKSFDKILLLLDGEIFSLGIPHKVFWFKVEPWGERL